MVRLRIAITLAAILVGLGVIARPNRRRPRNYVPRRRFTRDTPYHHHALEIAQRQRDERLGVIELGVLPC